MKYNILNLFKSKCVFVKLLSLLNVKHTKRFSEESYYKYYFNTSLYDLANLLHIYNIDNLAIRIDDKESFMLEIDEPFIAYINNEFILILQVSEDCVSFWLEGKKIEVTKNEFCSIWSGIALLFEADEKSIEPNYAMHRKQNIHKIIVDMLFLFSIIFFSIISLINFGISYINTYILVLLNYIGVFVSFSLLQKQLNIHDNYADRICSLFTKMKSCDSVLKSKVSSIAGLFSFSEIGLGYFISNIIFICLLPHLYSFCILMSLCSLPFTIWSFYYQKVVIKQWCPLCLTVLLILWLLFFNNYLIDITSVLNLNVVQFFYSISIYLVCILVINLIIAIFYHKLKEMQNIRELNRIKYNKNVFVSILYEQPYYNVDILISSIILGNEGARHTLTIVTNPQCNPCALLHDRLKIVLNYLERFYKIQFVFTSFENDKNNDCLKLISLYMKNDDVSFYKVLEDWYQKGRFDNYWFNQRYISEINIESVYKEYEEHSKWLKRMDIKSTPIVLLDGYKMPYEYVIDDLLYFSDL